MTDHRLSPGELSHLRDQLRKLGYLDSRLERFFLKDVGRARLGRAILGNAAKLGLTAGPLVGALVWLGQVARRPELAGEPLDLFILGAYVSLAAGVMIAWVGLGIGLGLVVATKLGIVDRLPTTYWARGLGFGLGICLLVYLTLWWRERGETDLASLAAVFLGVWSAFAVSRLGTLAVFGVLAVLVPEKSPSSESLSRARTLKYVAGGALVYAILFAATQGSTASRVLTASPYELFESRYRIRVIGIDGLSFDGIERMRQSSSLPGFERLADEAAFAELALEPERAPSVIWTSLATGQDPHGHGIRAMRADAVLGVSTPFQMNEQSTLARVLGAFRLSESRPVDTGLRRAKTVWDILSDQGRTTRVTGWWASWPAEPLSGHLLTDRLFFKLAQKGPFEKETDSVELFHRLSESFEKDRREAIESLGELHARAGVISGPELALALERDAYHLKVSEALEREAPPELDMLYLSGLDIASMKLLDSGAETLDDTVAAVQFLEDYLEWLDGWVERWVERAGPEEILVLLAEPGRVGDPATSRGAVFIVGGPFRAGASVSSSNIYDIAPTILYLLGFPVSDEMHGRVLTSVLDSQLESAPVRRIETFGSKRIAPAGLQSGFDQEMIRQLQSLGYIE